MARRYRRLRRDGIMRIVGLVDPAALGQSTWMVRVQCRPDGVRALADALARRDDTAWVNLSAGGSEVVCSVRSRTRAERIDLLTHRLPQTSPVLGIDAFAVLHRFPGSVLDDWTGFGDVLSAAQTQRFGRGGGRSDVDRPATGVVRLDAADDPMLEVLGRDGRAGHTALATAAGWTPAQAARRLSALLAAKAVYLDVDLAAEALGFGMQAGLWLTVAPGELRAAGAALDALPEVAFAAAITGKHNLYAAVVCHDLDELYGFVADRVGAIRGVQTLEVSPVHRTVKQAGALTAGDRLAEPAPPPRRRAVRAAAG